MLNLKEKAFDMLTFATSIVESTATAQAMVADAHLAATAQVIAERLTDCRQCQAEIQNLYIAKPTATYDEIEEFLHNAWETCGACSEDYNAHLDRQASEWEERQDAYIDNPSEWEKQNGLCEGTTTYLVHSDRCHR